MKKTAIVTGGTNNLFPAMATLALNLADVSPNVADDFVILHDGVDETDKNKLQKAVAGIFDVKFIEYKTPFGDVKNFEDTVSKYFSLMVFCKYECWKLLDEYECVIWIDYDMFVRKDISELRNMGKYYSKFIEDHILGKKFNSSIFWQMDESQSEFDVFGNGITSAIFVLHNSFSGYKKFYDECLALTVEYAKSLYLPEEAVISILFQKYRIEFEKLESWKYFTTPSHPEDFDRCSIIHAVGQPKFWNGLDYAPWQKYYDMWRNKYGGEIIFVKKEYKMPLILKIL